MKDGVVHEVGGYQLSLELVRRKSLTEQGLKMGAQEAYCKAWLVKKRTGADTWEVVKYFLTEEEAREFAQGDDKKED